MYCPDDAKLQQFCKDMGFSFVDFLALQARVQYHPRQLFGTFSPCFSCFFPVLGNSSVVGDPKCLYHFMCTNCKAFHDVLSPEEEAIKNRNVVEITSNAGVSRPELESVLSAEPANLQFIPCGVNSEVCQKFAEIQKNTVVTTRINGVPSCFPCFAFGKVASSPPPSTMLEKAVLRLIDDQVALDAGEEVEFPALSDFISDVSLSVEGKWYDPSEVYRYPQDYLQMSPAQRALKSVGFQDLLKKLKE
ncbi:hypothetical protein BDY24DRAFT_390138 [Mrakia frigida]|uniref:uncharacterized protein n=1 Tax=Mrakia frigida TaxID=29902 RepID=UPI003FCC1093